jgi:hypothetical protein
VQLFLLKIFICLISYVAWQQFENFREKTKAGCNCMPKREKEKEKAKENEVRERFEQSLWLETRPQGP